MFLYLLFLMPALGNINTIDNIASKCAILIQNPNDKSSYEMLKRTLDVNCFEYYNVHADESMLMTVENIYNLNIDAFKNYTESVSENEQVLYSAKNWLSMAAADPLSLYQRQAKECNAQLLMSSFGNEDMSSELPIFLQSLEYMSSCFSDVVVSIDEARTSLLLEFDRRIDEVEAASEHMHSMYAIVSTGRLQLLRVQTDFARNIVDTFNNIYS
tara:strand:+ start:4872 stop:5513 length:642 start_codon:yes stop_codon:yes gene_type:complete